jgi:rhodanese-related sulfurtransferase
MTDLISRSELERLIATGDVVLVDALPATYYDQQHLPGAVNLVAEDVTARAEELVPDKTAAIVVYCSNAACGNSRAVADKLARLGYSQVRKYRDGIQDWVDAGLPTESGAQAA